MEQQLLELQALVIELSNRVDRLEQQKQSEEPITIKQAAQKLDCHEITLYRLVRANRPELENAGAIAAVGASGRRVVVYLDRFQRWRDGTL